MFEKIKQFHLITNFPKNYPFHKKILANIGFIITGIIIHPRKNLLSHKDTIKARFILRKGDVVLLGDLKKVSSLIIRGPFTHATIYAGRKRFIEAVQEGVRYTTFHHLFTTYDTLLIMRIPKKTKDRKKKIKAAIEIAKKQIGKPYDFDFSGKANNFFCTELVNYSFKKAKHDTKLESVSKFKKMEKDFVKKYISASHALHPVKFAEEGNFDIIFMSHNLQSKNKILLKSSF
ncbi:hypothetical protein COV12_01215 [Candidatus Woesearchaeota archaeon CG10_big_fil_rev_8_21_14_0_10_32_24]|nr:MAG: hypothetical protein COV12_01215 [Candidatus Woesearchaeota archaeon CG10_big_fil_rev_8_21_14_0_10_32_24]